MEHKEYVPFKYESSQIEMDIDDLTGSSDPI